MIMLILIIFLNCVSLIVSIRGKEPIYVAIGISFIVLCGGFLFREVKTTPEQKEQQKINRERSKNYISKLLDGQEATVMELKRNNELLQLILEKQDLRVNQ